MLSALKKRKSRAFEKDAWCLLGLPFDVLSLHDVCDAVMDAFEKKKQMVLSVTNINWIVLASSDHSFWSDIARSDLNLIDGTPLFWCARFLGLPIPERIAGPSLVEYLSRIKRVPRKSVYFFGGAEGVAEAACQKMGATELSGAGFCNPGFGTLEDMSREEYLREINKSVPDLLILSIGAKKGMAWITKNKGALAVPVISYLGQVINLIGGRIRRAPEWLQIVGGEWLWRIFQEPVLWKRYFFDGLAFVKIFILKILPLKVFMLLNDGKEKAKQLPEVEVREENGQNVIFIKGVCNRLGREEIERVFWEASLGLKNIVIDLSGADYVESSFFGRVLLLWKRQKDQGRALSIRGISENTRKIFYLYGMERFLTARCARETLC